MTHDDFHFIKHFTAEEIMSTGASLASVQYDTIHYLDNVRKMIGKPFRLLRGGLTTGKHSAPEHKQGKAVDFTVDGLTEADVTYLVFTLISCGFRGIGVYRNSIGALSFHADTRAELATWYGTKSIGEQNWTYSKLRMQF